MNRQQRRDEARTRRRTGRSVTALGSAAVLASAGAGAAVMLASHPAGAGTTYVVNSLDDVDDSSCDVIHCSLREAILASNGIAGQDQITFSVTGTITLTSDLVHNYDAVHINGPGTANLTVDGGDAYTVFVFDYVGAPAGTNELTGLTVTGGRSAGGGAVQLDHGSATTLIQDVVLTTNYSTEDGGAIEAYYFTGDLTIDRATITRNSAAMVGGGVYVTGMDTGSLTISDSSITYNEGLYGAGVYVINSDATITGTTITDNAAYGGGGGIQQAGASGDLTVSASVISGNAATSRVGGGISAKNSHDTTIIDTTIDSNTSLYGGAGVYIDDGNLLTITNSTVSNNTSTGTGASATGGGAYIDMYETVIRQSTISGNSAAQAGGIELADNGGATIELSTITDNEAVAPYGGAAVHGIRVAYYATSGPVEAGTVILTGSIVAGNGDLDLGSYDGGPIDVQALASIVGEVDVDTTVTDLGGTQEGVTAAALKLGPLADNGGPTRTHLPLAGSPAIDAGPATADLPVFDGSEFDQRGEPYVRVYNGTADVGSVEVQPDPTPGPGPGPEPVPEPTFTG